MALIKAHSAASLIKEAIVLDLGDLGRQAAKMQAAFETKARQTVADAEREAARLIDEARHKGFDEGKAQGIQQGLIEGRKQGRAEAIAQATPQFKQIQDSWLTIAKDWDANRAAMEREGPHRVLELALRLAEKLVHRVIEIDPTVVVDQVGTALGQVLKDLDIAIHIHPLDKPVLEQAMPQLQTEFSHLKHVRLAEDEAVGQGGCLIVYGQGQIDATIDTQLRRVVELMLPSEDDL